MCGDCGISPITGTPNVLLDLLGRAEPAVELVADQGVAEPEQQAQHQPEREVEVGPRAAPGVLGSDGGRVGHDAAGPVPAWARRRPWRPPWPAPAPRRRPAPGRPAGWRSRALIVMSDRVGGLADRDLADQRGGRRRRGASASMHVLGCAACWSRWRRTTSRATWRASSAIDAGGRVGALAGADVAGRGRLVDLGLRERCTPRRHRGRARPGPGRPPSGRAGS